jgi:nitrate/nitrite transporter NarK
MDIATYGVGIFTPSILAALAFEAEHSLFGQEIASLEGAAFLDLFLMVGFLLAIFLIDRVGRIRLQLLGFGVMAVGLGILAVATELPGGADQHLILVWVGFTLFNLFMNMGPNTTTYVLPAELFPTRLRASGHGLAAAAGKLGATVGIFFLPIWQLVLGLGPTLALVAAAALLGMAATWAFRVETAGRSLSDFE